jgi:NADPH-dependent 2,4-dienoyl-CoA reductase/sulfur reductase-like enzyme
MSPSEQIVIVGASLAGLRALEALRREGHDGPLIAIGAEPHPPYDRPPLSKQFLTGDWQEDRLWLRRDGVEDLDVEWHLGVAAASLDPAERRVWLQNGEQVRYDKLLLATGTVARRLPFGNDLAGIHRLRSLEESRSLRADLDTASHVGVIGAGFIGMEVAASCRRRGLAVTVIEPLAQPLIRGLGATLGAWVGDLHRDAGVVLRCGVGVEGFEGNDRVEGIQLSDGSTLQADLVVVGIGARPATDWLADSGLALDDGVVCNGGGATNLPGVFAAGDVARWQGTRLEHWTSAVEQGGHAAARLLKGDEVGDLAHVPYVWTDQFDLRLQIAGHVEPGDEMHVCHGSLAGEADARFLALFGRGGKLAAAVGNKRPRQLMATRKLLALGTSFQDAIEANP